VGVEAGKKLQPELTEQLVGLGFESGRMKTGTTPRVEWTRSWIICL